MGFTVDVSIVTWGVILIVWTTDCVDKLLLIGLIQSVTILLPFLNVTENELNGIISLLFIDNAKVANSLRKPVLLSFFFLSSSSWTKNDSNPSNTSLLK